MAKVYVDNKKIVGLMAENHITQESLGEKVGLSVVSIRLRLNGSIDWRITELGLVADLFGIPLNGLIVRANSEATAAQ